MTTETPPAGRGDALYQRARQLVLFHGDANIARLQRRFRISHQHATALRDAMCGDILEYRGHDASWHIRHAIDMAQDLLLDKWLDSSQAPLVIEIGAGRAIATVRHFSRRMQQRGSKLVRINLHESNIHNPDAIEIALGAKEALERIQQHYAVHA